MLGALPTTVELVVRLALTPSPWLLPGDFTGNVYGQGTPVVSVAVGTGPLEVVDTGAQVYVSLGFCRGVGEEGDVQVMIGDLTSFVVVLQDTSVLTLATMDEYTTEVWGHFAVPPGYVNLGPVNNLRHAQSSRTTMRVWREDDEYSLWIRSVQDPSDFNRDGTTDDEDFFDFMQTWCGVDLRADVNVDGVVDTRDFFEFLGVFLGL